MDMAKNKQWQEQGGDQTGQNDSIASNGVSEAQTGMESATPAEATTGPESSPSPISAPNSAIVAPVTNIDDLLANLSPDQLSKIKALAAAKGMMDGVTTGTGAIALDGSMTVAVKLEPDVVQQLENWREPTDATLSDTAVRYISEALTNYLYGQWPSIEDAPTEVVVVPAAAK